MVPPPKSLPYLYILHLVGKKGVPYIYIYTYTHLINAHVPPRCKLIRIVRCASKLYLAQNQEMQTFANERGFKNLEGLE